MARYQAKGDQTLTTTFVTGLSVGSNATTAQRNAIYRFILSIGLTPSDSQITWEGQRVSALGTSTAVTPGPLDPADRVAQAAVGENHTIEPTFVADGYFLEEMALNARATFMWNAFPGEVLTHAATVGAGLSWHALHATRTEDFLTQAYWEE
mgnify:CR=1 FL=1